MTESENRIGFVYFDLPLRGDFSHRHLRCRGFHGHLSLSPRPPPDKTSALGSMRSTFRTLLIRVHSCLSWAIPFCVFVCSAGSFLRLHHFRGLRVFRGHLSLSPRPPPDKTSALGSMRATLQTLLIRIHSCLSWAIPCRVFRGFRGFLPPTQCRTSAPSVKYSVARKLLHALPCQLTARQSHKARRACPSTLWKHLSVYWLSTFSRSSSFYRSGRSSKSTASAATTTPCNVASPISKPPSKPCAKNFAPRPSRLRYPRSQLSQKRSQIRFNPERWTSPPRHFAPCRCPGAPTPLRPKSSPPQSIFPLHLPCPRLHPRPRFPTRRRCCLPCSRLPFRQSLPRR